MNETSRAFSVGELVQLNSGGLDFTVISVSDDQVTVNWCDGKTSRETPGYCESKHANIDGTIEHVLSKKCGDNDHEN